MDWIMVTPIGQTVPTLHSDMAVQKGPLTLKILSPSTETLRIICVHCTHSCISKYEHTDHTDIQELTSFSLALL